MFVVHACWLGLSTSRLGGLAIWGEDSSAPTTPPRRPGRARRIQPHPYAATHAELEALLPPAARQAAMETATLTLPTRGGGPVASPELVRDEIGAVSGDLRAGMWQVPTLRLEPDLALALLRSLDVEAAAYGASVVHLIGLAGFAADLVARGRLLPVVLSDPPRAVWRPVVTGPDAAWARVLASSMPPPVVAASPGDGFAVWADGLDALVDAAARAVLDSTRLTIGRAGTPATRAWLAALTGSDRRFTADPPALAALTAMVAAWQQDAVEGSVRACFRLKEPVDDGEEWQLRFGLQAADEPSLFVDADEVWRSRGKKMPALARHVHAPQETFLAELGKASRLYPEIDGALRTARPLGLSLDTEGAHRFLSGVAPALATAGFGIQLPGWWTKPSSRLGLKVSASTPSQPGRVAADATVIGFDSIASFRYELAVGGEALTSEEVAQLAELKAPMVRLRGQWIELDPRRLAAGLKLAGQTGQARVGELIRLGLGVDAAPDGLPVAEVEADGWLGELLSGRVEHSVAAVDTPDSFHGQLRPYQARGLSWLDFLGRAGLGGVLADDMGLGKTVQLLALLAYEQNGGPPSLLVCPMSLVGNWQREAARFTPGCECTFIMAPSGPVEVTSAKRLPAAILWSPRMHLPRGTPPISARSPGGASSSTKRRRSRTPPPSRPPRSARSRRALGLPSPERRWKTASPTCGPSSSSPIPGCSDLQRRSRSATPSRSSVAVMTTPRIDCDASPGRSSCAASRPTRRSSLTCPRSWRWIWSAT